MKTYIREFRKSRNMTLKQLAEKINTTPQTVQRLETDNMTVSMAWLEKIAIALQVEPYKLLTPISDLPPRDGFVELTMGALIANKRTIPNIGDVPLEMVVASGKLADLVLNYDKGAIEFDGIPEAAAAVAAAAMRIAIDGRALRGVKMGEAA